MRSIRLKIIIFIVLMQVLTAAISFAAPAVTGITGTSTNGSIITVTGTGFGANGPTIELYDEFESGTIGNVISLTAGSATINEWSGSNGSGLTTYTNEWSHSGTKSMKNNWDTPTAEPGNQMQLDFSDATEIFYSFWTMVPSGKNVPGDTRPIVEGGGGGTNTPNWKMSWVWGGVFNNAHANEYASPVMVQSNLSTPYPLLFTYNTSQGRVTGGEQGDHMTKGEWSRIDHYVKGGVTDGILHAVETDATHGIVTKVNKIDVFTLENGYAWNHITIPGYGRGQTTNGVTVYDDVYVATGLGARARVEIGNASTYAASTNIQIATVTSWSDTSVQATLRQGSLANFNGAYLYIIDANGTVNTNGYPLCPNCPKSPTNLQAQ